MTVEIQCKFENVQALENNSLLVCLAGIPKLTIFIYLTVFRTYKYLLLCTLNRSLQLDWHKRCFIRKENVEGI